MIWGWGHRPAGTCAQIHPQWGPPQHPDPCCSSDSRSETGGTRLSRGLDFLEVFRIRFSGCFSAGWKASSPCRSHGSKQNFPLKMSDYSKYGEKKKKKSLAEDAAQKPSVTWAPLPSSWELRRDGGSPPFSFIYLFLFFFPPPRRANEQWGPAVGLGLLVGAYFGLAPGGGWVPAAGAGGLAQRRLWRGFLPRQLGASRVQVASEDTGPAASFGFTFIFPSPGPNPAPAPHAWAVPGFCSAHAGGASGVFCELRWIALGFL